MLSQKSIASVFGSNVVIASSSMTRSGIARPFGPIRSAAGSAFERDSVRSSGFAIPVVVSAPENPASTTSPETDTRSPTATSSVISFVETKIPSEVASSRSGFGSCIQKPGALPVASTAVPMPSTASACFPSNGDRFPPTWVS